MLMSRAEKPPIASEPILITSQAATNVDPILLDAIQGHFKKLEEAGTTLTGEQFILELANAYCEDYWPIITKANINCDDTFESAMAKFAPIDIKLINCLIADQSISTRLLTYFHDIVEAEIQLIETMFEINPASSFSIRHTNSLRTWKVLFAKIVTS